MISVLVGLSRQCLASSMRLEECFLPEDFLADAAFDVSAFAGSALFAS